MAGFPGRRDPASDPGQVLVLVLVASVPATQWVVSRPWYQRVVVRGGPVLLIGLSAAWFWQRVA